MKIDRSDKNNKATTMAEHAVFVCIVLFDANFVEGLYCHIQRRHSNHILVGGLHVFGGPAGTSPQGQSPFEMT